MLCQFTPVETPSGLIFVCSRCGRRTGKRKSREERVVAQCRKPGLGDYVARGLSLVGITKKRVASVLGQDCGCDQRQEQLNEVGQKLGL